MSSLIAVHGLLTEADRLYAQIDRKLSEAERKLVELGETSHGLLSAKAEAHDARRKLAVSRRLVRERIEERR